MTSTAVTDFMVAFVYLAAAVRRPLVAAWHATKPERTKDE